MAIMQNQKTGDQAASSASSQPTSAAKADKEPHNNRMRPEEKFSLDKFGRSVKEMAKNTLSSPVDAIKSLANHVAAFGIKNPDAVETSFELKSDKMLLVNGKKEPSYVVSQAKNSDELMIQTFNVSKGVVTKCEFTVKADGTFINGTKSVFADGSKEVIKTDLTLNEAKYKIIDIHKDSFRNALFAPPALMIPGLIKERGFITPAIPASLREEIGKKAIGSSGSKGGSSSSH